MSKPKAIRPAEIDPITQPWHAFVDTLRLLPSFGRAPNPDPVQELRAAQKEKKTLDDAFEQVTNLIRLRRGDLPPGPTAGGSAASESAVVLPSPAIPPAGTPGNEASPATGAGGSGLKRKRGRGSVSISPAPQSAPVENQTLAVPRLDGGAKSGPAGGVAMTPVNSSGSAALGLGVGLGINHGHGLGRSSASPFPPTRSGTPTSRQLTGRERKDALSDQLPLLKGRRVVFKQPQASKDKSEEGEEDAWILGTIVECIGGDRNRYKVLDADDQAETPTYNTTLRSIIPLPDSSLPLSSPAHPANIDDFPKGTRVLALYPDTTSFYPAKVLVPPSRNKVEGKRMYRLFFDGDEVEYTDIAAGDVVMMPAGNVQR